MLFLFFETSYVAGVVFIFFRKNVKFCITVFAQKNAQGAHLKIALWNGRCAHSRGPHSRFLGKIGVLFRENMGQCFQEGRNRTLAQTGLTVFDVCTIWYHFCSLKKVKNTYAGVLLY